MGSHDWQTATDTEHDVALESATLEPPLFNVVMHNDHFTTMDFVVFVLCDVFGYPDHTAITLMMQVHEKGRAIVATLTKEIAETKIAKVEFYAEKAEFPLLMTLEPA